MDEEKKITINLTINVTMENAANKIAEEIKRILP